MAILVPERGESRSCPASELIPPPEVCPSATAPKRCEKATTRLGRVGPLMIILFLGSILRLLVCFWFNGGALTIWDERDYNRLAVNLCTRGEFGIQPGKPTSLRPPLYPAVVAAVYALFGLGN